MDLKKKMLQETCNQTSCIFKKTIGDFLKKLFQEAHA